MTLRIALLLATGFATLGCFAEPVLDRCSTQQDCPPAHTCYRDYCFAQKGGQTGPPDGSEGPAAGDVCAPAPVDAPLQNADVLWSVAGLGIGGGLDPNQVELHLVGAADGLVVVARRSGEVEAINALTGATKWTVSLGKPAFCPISAGNGRWLVSTTAGVYLLTPHTSAGSTASAKVIIQAELRRCVAFDSATGDAVAVDTEGRWRRAGEAGSQWTKQADAISSPVLLESSPGQLWAAASNSEGKLLVASWHSGQPQNVHEYGGSTVHQLSAAPGTVGALTSTGSEHQWAVLTRSGQDIWNDKVAWALPPGSGAPAALAWVRASELVLVTSGGALWEGRLVGQQLIWDTPSRLAPLPHPPNGAWVMAEGGLLLSLSTQDQVLQVTELERSPQGTHRFALPSATTLSTAAITLAAPNVVVVSSPQKVIALKIPCLGSTEPTSPWTSPRGNPANTARVP